MSKKYNQLGSEQRYQIEALLRSGQKQKDIAFILEVHPSTISRELKRNIPKSGVGAKLYRASNAQRRTDLRHRIKSKAMYFQEEHKVVCRRLLEELKYSPELISEVGKRKLGGFVSHETIYKWIWQCKFSHREVDQQDRKLYLKLRHGRRRHKRGNRNDKRGNIPFRIGIEQRPAIVHERVRLGDLEVDLMLGSNHKSAILVSLDRASLRIRLHKLKSKHSLPVKKILIRAYQNKAWVKTITFDNDSAFIQHHEIAQALNIQSYFTRPYTSQDKGSVENRIGIIRRFLPKGVDFNQLTSKELRSIENKINNRPVRKFNYKTPNKVFLEKLHL